MLFFESYLPQHFISKFPPSYYHSLFIPSKALVLFPLFFQEEQKLQLLCLAKITNQSFIKKYIIYLPNIFLYSSELYFKNFLKDLYIFSKNQDNLLVL